MARTKYVKVKLDPATPAGNFMGCVVVGDLVNTVEGCRQLLLERPDAKPRKVAGTRKPRTNAKAAAATASSATAFPGAGVSNGA
jgi:hypothetical protein